MEIKPQFEIVMGRAKEALQASSYAELGRMLGLSTSAYANRKRADSIPYDLLLPVAHSRGVSADWLIFGEGESVLSADQKARQLPEVDCKLMTTVLVELAKAFSSSPLTYDELVELGQRAGLAGLIYNRVAHMPDDAERVAAIKRQVQDFAQVASIMQANAVHDRPTGKRGSP